MGIKTINGLAKGLTALSHIAQTGSTTVRQLAGELCMPEATAARILKTLHKEGFLLRVRARRQYWITRRLSELAHRAPPLALVVQAAGSHLDAIASTHDVAAMVSSGNTARMEVLRANQRPAKLAITRFVPGYTFPSEEGASGLILLAHARTRGAQLKAIRKAGFAITPNRLDARELCLAVPIVVGGQVCASLELRCMKAVAGPEIFRQRFLPIARAHATQIGREVEALTAKRNGAALRHSR
jgi:DNA-binding IclR family transcriptional regulator